MRAEGREIARPPDSIAWRQLSPPGFEAVWNSWLSRLPDGLNGLENTLKKLMK
jgi:hypothetical protein